VPVRSTRDLISEVSSKAPGQKVRLTFLREGRSLTATVTLAERQSESTPATRPSSLRGGGGGEAPRGKLGLQLTELTPEIRRELRISSDVSGVVVEDVADVSPAADQGIAAGDVITEVNGKPVRSVGQFRDEVTRARKGEYLRLYVRRFVPQPISRYVLIPVDW
jgi:serine protease Do